MSGVYSELREALAVVVPYIPYQTSSSRSWYLEKFQNSVARRSKSISSTRVKYFTLLYLLLVRSGLLAGGAQRKISPVISMRDFFL